MAASFLTQNLIKIKVMLYNDKVTILVSSARSFASLARAIHTINESLYGENANNGEKIMLKDVYEKDGSLHHFEITGTPLDLFQVGLRYGGYEAEKHRPRLAI